MKITDVLRGKGSNVVTIGPNATVTDLLRSLTEHNIGAIVVTDGAHVVGIVSERDIVRQLHTFGTGLLTKPVSSIMTSPVVTCTPTDSIDSLSVTMTERRIRHLPVVDGGRLIGVVSIGDVVKHRVAELESDRKQLESYIHG